MCLNSGCCTACGFMSLLGAVFYSILAIMTARRNPVFLEHKVGMNQFTWTDEEINAKFWDIAFSAIVSVLLHNKNYFQDIFFFYNKETDLNFSSRLMPS